MTQVDIDNLTPITDKSILLRIPNKILYLTLVLEVDPLLMRRNLIELVLIACIWIQLILITFRNICKPKQVVL